MRPNCSAPQIWRTTIGNAREAQRIMTRIGAPMPSHGLNRRAFLQGTAAAATLASTRPAGAADATELKPIQAEIEKRHDQAVRLLQEWIHQPSIAAENRGMTEGCDLQMRLLRDAGFNQVTKVPTAGH